MNIKRTIARAIFGGPEPKLIQTLDAHTASLRSNDRARAVYNAVAEESARENRAWVVPLLAVATPIHGVAIYYLRNIIPLSILICFAIAMNAFIWYSFCVPKRR